MPIFPSEQAEQRALMDYARLTAAPCGLKLADYLIHIPNGGWRQRTEAAILNGLGVKAGVSDFFLALPWQGLPGLWLELKRVRRAYGGPKAQANAVSANQAAWLERMRAAGYATAVVYGAEEAIAAIECYLDCD